MKILLISPEFSLRWQRLYEESTIDLYVICSNSIMQGKNIHILKCKGKFYLSSFKRCAKAWLRAHQDAPFDIIVASSYAVSLGLLARKIYKSPLLVDLMRMPSRAQVITHFFLRKSDAIVAPSISLKRLAARTYKKPAHSFVGGAYFQKDFLRIKNAKSIVILCVGELDEGAQVARAVSMLSNYAHKTQTKIKLKFLSRQDPSMFLEREILHLDILHYNFYNKLVLAQELEICDAILFLKRAGTNFDVFFGMGEKPILAFCNKCSDEARILRHTKSGMLIENELDLNDFLQKNHSLDLARASLYTKTNQANMLKSFCTQLR